MNPRASMPTTLSTTTSPSSSRPARARASTTRVKATWSSSDAVPSPRGFLRSAMHDDGKEGDEHAGDHVWTLRATLPAGTRVRYVYTNSGGQGRWEGLDLPHVREVQAKAPANGGPMYLPVESFGKIYMQADNWHTDAVGYDLIARAVAAALR